MLLVFTLVFSAGSGAAQVSGILRNPGGEIASGVMVDLWVSGRVVASRLSDSTGHFVFPGPAGLDTYLIAYRGLDASTLHRVPEGPQAFLDLVLPPVRLAGVAGSAPSLCPAREDPEARRWWEETRRRYRPVPDSAMIGTGFLVTRETADASDFGQAGDPGFAESPFAVRTAWNPMPTRLRIDRDGYARRQRSGSFTGEFDGWEYARLGSVAAPHFAMALFGRLKHLPFR